MGTTQTQAFSLPDRQRDPNEMNVVCAHYRVVHFERSNTARVAYRSGR